MSDQAKAKKLEWRTSKAIMLHAFKGACRSYSLGFGMKSLVSLIIRIAKHRQISRDMIYQSLDFRFANMIGSFTFIWKLMSNSLYRKTGRHTKLNGFISGFLAGISIGFETKTNRIGYAQQFCMRALHASKNHSKVNGIYVPHSDSILFSIASASILYAFCFRPDTIPREYFGWMRDGHKNHIRAQEKLGQDCLVDREMITRVFENATTANKKIIDDYINKNNGSMPGIIYIIQASLAVYSIQIQTAVRFIRVLHILICPIIYLKRILYGVVRSSTFLASYITLFQIGTCMHFYFRPNASTKNWIYILSLLCGLTIFIEQKTKRPELAMFVLPKAAMSLYMILIDYGLYDLNGLEIGIHCLSMGTLMAFYQTEPDKISSMLLKAFNAFLGPY